MSDVCSHLMPDFSAKMHQIQFPPSPPISWLQYSVTASVVFQKPRLQHAKLLEDQEPEALIHDWTTLTKNCSRFTLMFKLHEIWSVDSPESY